MVAIVLVCRLTIDISSHSPLSVDAWCRGVLDCSLRFRISDFSTELRLCVFLVHITLACILKPFQFGWWW